MILGIDIGGTGIKLGVVDIQNGRVLADSTIPTGADRPADAIIADIVTAATPLAATYHPTAVGIGSAGRIDPVNGVVLRAGNLPFRGEPLCRKLGEPFGLPAYIDNDGNCALLAEAAFGACKGDRDAIMITLGTGVGGAILINGAIYRGHNFRAGEIGHFILDHNGMPCECGLHGCYEHYASATALIARTRDAVAAHPDSLLAAHGRDAVTGKTAFAAAQDGCPVAEAVLADYAAHVAMGINSMVKLFMPERVVLAGGITKAGEALLSRLTPHLLPEADVRLSTLGGNAGLIGAALTAR